VGAHELGLGYKPRSENPEPCQRRKQSSPGQSMSIQLVAVTGDNNA